MSNPLWFNEDEPNNREMEILGKIRQYLADHQCDTHSHGYDEGFEDAESRFAHDYERGYNDALEAVMEMVEPSGLFPTPDSKKDMGVILEAYHDKAVLVLKAYMNYLATQIESMER